MTVIKMLIGVAGVGKSTYIKQHKTEKSLVLSSDEMNYALNCLAIWKRVMHLKLFQLFLKHYMNE